MIATNVSFKSWSQTRLYDYDQCPLMAKLKHLVKLCPLCFKGSIKGGYDTPAICQSCGKEVVKGAALVRGSAVGLTLENYVKGNSDGVHHEITNPGAKKLALSLRRDFQKQKVLVERMWNFDKDWKPLPAGWSPKVWLIVKTDVFRTLTAKKGEVIDWKTGGIDKSNGKPRASKNYEEQLRIYSVAGLCAFPSLTEVRSSLCFVDTADEHDPVIEMGVMPRKDLEKNRKALANRVFPMFKDDTFAPRANDKCRFCDFQKGKGGPCPY